MAKKKRKNNKNQGPSQQAGPSTTSNSNDRCSWWNQFSGFTPNPYAGVAKEFDRLAEFMGWTGKEFRKRKTEAYEAEFNFHFVHGKSKLETWRELCAEVGVESGGSITQCKKNLKGVLINIVNLLNHRRNPAVTLIKFATFRQFRDSTMRSGNMINREMAKEDGFLRVFLRVLRGKA
ncbi:uncharacterized protein EI97DRAFT_468529 [Westerdykella ornata]|uniref:Uncharacterized protein n=1 Tax=Westerdykella ornata TaxID=318751 RepID=A0A6A6JDE7_WESOR|nr:uncharacterized protein EI97DRAFT_468529 [Westerdykella ornata]KAF2274630.1 hypothetical protein EI97DRAFT_468529 [Westerdykella ornata]